MARHDDQYKIYFDSVTLGPTTEHYDDGTETIAAVADDYSNNTLTFTNGIEYIDYRETINDNGTRSIDYSAQENRLKNLEDKMDFLIKKLKVELPSCEDIKFSDWKEFLENIGVAFDEDVLFLLEQNFNLPTSKKKNMKNDAEVLINKYGYDLTIFDKPEEPHDRF